MQAESINREIAAIIDRRISSDDPVQLNWIVHEFVKGHDRISGDDVDLYRTALYAFVRDRAKRMIKKYDYSDDLEQPDLLPGHEHLRVAYSVTRDGEQMLVPIDLCSDEELLMRAGEFERSAAGLRSHAAELKEYVGARRTTLGFETSDGGSRSNESA